MSQASSPLSLSPSGWNMILVDQPHFFESFLQESLTDFRWQDRPFFQISINSSDWLNSDSILLDNLAIIWLNYEPSDASHLALLNQIRTQHNNQETAIILTLNNNNNNNYPDESLILQYDIHDLVVLNHLSKAKVIATLVTALKTYQFSRDQQREDHGLQPNQQITQIKERIEHLLQLDQQLQQEINYRETIEKALLKSQKKLASILNLAQDAIISINQNQIITLFNQGASNIFGYDPSEVLGQSLDILLPESLRKIHYKHIENYQKSSFTNKSMNPFREITARRKDGTEFFAEASIFKIKLENEMILTVILRDISERKEAEKELQISYNSLEQKVQQRTTSLEKINQELTQEINERIRIEEALRNIAIGVQSKDCHAFFESMAQYIARALNIEYVLMGELINSEQISSLAFCINGELTDAITYSIINTPCEKVIQEKKCLYHNNLRQEFSKSQWLQDWEIDSYMGMPLIDNNQQVLGVICVLSPRPFCNPNFIKEVLQIFAARAGSELERLQAEAALKENEEALKTLNQNLEKLVSVQTLQLQKLVEQLRQEIEQHQQTENALRQSEERWQLAIQGTNEGIWDWDSQTNKVFYSQRWKEMLGYENDEIGNALEEWSSRVHPDDLDRVMKILEAHLKGETSYYQSEHRMRCKNGHYKWILDRGKALRDQTGKPIRVVGSHSDIHDRKQIEESVRQNEYKLRKITALVPGMVFQFGVRPNNDFFATFVSDGVWDLYELTPEVIIDDITQIFNLINPEQLASFWETLEHSRQHLSEFRFDYQITIPSGQKKWIYAHCLPQLLEDKTVIWYGIFTDITEQKRQQQEILEAKAAADAANSAKSEFLANMSHEIRTPMNAILGFCQLLLDYIHESRPRSYLNAIISSGNTLLALINDILDLSKIEAGKLELNYESVNLRSLLQEIHQIFSQKARQKSLSLVLELDNYLPTAIIFDEIRLRQILFNLIGNAIKFTEQGKITLSLMSMPTDRPEYIQMILKITDTGIGINPEQLNLIFESFRQQEGQSSRKYGGTGLGLTITKRLVEMLGGKISVTSQQGSGSVFTITFPNVSLAQRTHPETFFQENPLNEDLNQFSPLKILVADDTQSNLDLIEGYFAQSHHELIFAHNGQQTIAFTHQYEPDLIFLDLRMPKLDGNAVAQYLKRTTITQNIPIIVLTASALRQEEELIQPFCEGFLRKPVTRRQLIEILQTLFPFIPAKLSNISSPSFDAFTPSPELVKKLSPLVDHWQEVSKTKITKHIREFYGKVIDLGQQYSCKPLLDYGKILKNQLENFDIDNLDQTLEQFLDLVEQIEFCSVQNKNKANP